MGSRVIPAMSRVASVRHSQCDTGQVLQLLRAWRIGLQFVGYRTSADERKLPSQDLRSRRALLLF